MLEELPEETFSSPTYRLANKGDYAITLAEMGIDAVGVEEILGLLKEGGLTGTPDEYLDGPFKYRPFHKADKTRFSDGSFRVFYSSLEPETAKAEAEHYNLRCLLGDASGSRTIYFQLIQCAFSGVIKDLRAQLARWPFLIEEDDAYDRCNSIGGEAHVSGLDGLLTQSARKVEGTNLPVFKRDSLSNPEIRGSCAFEFDPISKAIGMHHSA